MCENVEEMKGNAYCGLIQDRSNENPFIDCILSPKSDYTMFFDMCVYDACVMANASCGALSTFAENCEDLGHIIDWREIAGCRKHSYQMINR